MKLAQSNRHAWAAVLVAVVVTISAGAGPTNARAGTLSWSTPQVIDLQPPYSTTRPAAIRGLMTGVSCVSTSFCAAIDSEGRVATTLEPTGPPVAWHVDQIDNSSLGAAGSLTGIACPAVSLCVAVDASGNALTSSNPGARTPIWKEHRLVRPAGSPLLLEGVLTGVSCPTKTFCAATDPDGQVLTSHNPSSGVSNWRVQQVDQVNGIVGLDGLSCPTPHFCAASDFSGSVVVSTKTTRRGFAWKRIALPGASGLRGVSCPTSTLCVANDSTQLFVSTDPTAGPQAWKSAGITDTSLSGIGQVSCASAKLCLAFDSGGFAFVSLNPAGGPGAWTKNQIDQDPHGNDFLIFGGYGITCTKSPLCVAVDSNGQVVTSTNPSGGASAWTTSWIDGSNQISGLACPGLCVAVDQGGNVLTSADPLSANASWTVEHVEAGALSSISCPSSGLCVAVDASGDVVTSTNPAGGPNTWTVTHVDPGEPLNAVACPQVNECVAVDAAGNVVSSTDPTGGAAAWTISHVDDTVTVGGAGSSLTDIACPTYSLCVAVDNAGNILTSAQPTGSASSWNVADVDGTTPLTGVACASGKQCVVVDDTDDLTSEDPAGGVSAWALTGIGTGFTNVWCPARSSSCFAAGANRASGVGFNAVTLDPAADSWGNANIPLSNLNGVGCPMLNRCVGVDLTGLAAAGNPTPPPSIGRLRAQLFRALLPAGQRSSISSIVQRRGYSLSLTASGATSLSVRWYQVTSPKRLGHRSKPSLIAAGNASVRHAGPLSLDVRLTGHDSLGIRGATKLSVMAQGRMKTAGHTVMVSRDFVLRRHQPATGLR
jgi:hypothetical protein